MRKKLLSLTLLFAVVFTMGFYVPTEAVFSIETQEQQESADEKEIEADSVETAPGQEAILSESKEERLQGSGETAISVKLDGVITKTFSMEELETIATEEGNITYNYSAWNTYPTFNTYKDIKGPTVNGILNAAGIKKVNDTNTISFEGNNYKMSLTGSQLNEDRYYYPNAVLVNQQDGIMEKDSFEGKAAVPAVISLMGDTCLYVGQVAPNEENNPLFVKYIAKGGTIDISTKAAEQCGAVVVDQPALSLQKDGATITVAKAEGSNIHWEYDKIYYTFDTDKDKIDTGNGKKEKRWVIYNCGPKKGMVCKPVCKARTDPDKPEYQNRKVILQIKVKGYGKRDSEIQTFTYYVGDALTVKVDGVAAKSYATRESLENEFTEEVASYSGYNTYPSFSKKTDRTGISVDSIINDAMSEAGKKLNDDAVITFTGNDGYSTKITAGQLFADRYYYPNAEAGTDSKGGSVKAEAYEGKKIVPSIIETGNNNSLLFGQTEPNEQNFAECVDGMLTIGQISIDTSTKPEKCESVTETVPAGDSTVTAGQTIKLPFPAEENKRDKICYIVDPEEEESPGLASGFYNYSAYRYSEQLANPPVLTKPGKHVIKVKTVGYGKLDSDVTTFTYNVVLGNVEGFKAASSGYNSITLRWNSNPGATGYEIYRKSGSSYVRIKTITSSGITSYRNTGLKTGTTYYYKIRAISADNEGQPVYSSYALASVKPVPATPSVSLKAGSRKATVKWSRVSGASGYQVVRSLKKSSGFKTAKTVTSGSRTYYVNKKLKKGKTYYFKVRAYRKVSGKKIYGSYSTVKAVRVR